MRYFEKIALELNEPQKRVANVLQDPDQPGLLLYWNVGSGKTIGAINAANKMNYKSTVVVPASLQENFKKEINKARVSKKNFDIKSYEKFLKNPVSKNTDLLIVDEAHRIRDLKTKRSRAVLDSSNQFKKTLLLTGTPIVNKPFDIAPLINTVAKEKRLPETEKMFNKIFIDRKVESPSLLEYIFAGKRSKTVHDVKNPKLFRKLTDDVVDYVGESNSKEFPKRKDISIKTPMSAGQTSLYKFYEKQLPTKLRKKIEYNISPSRQEAKQLNAFLSATRQLSTSTNSFSVNKEESPKIKKIVELVKKDKGPSLIYSNYLDSGLYPLTDTLKKHKLPYGLFTGKQTSKEKDTLVKEYNSGKMKALLISSSGGEGLDLKNTAAVHIVAPEWNDPRIEQVIGRAVRYKSHTAPNSTVKIYKHISKFPEESNSLLNLFGLLKSKKPKATTDDYLYAISDQKKQLNDKFLNLLKD